LEKRVCSTSGQRTTGNPCYHLPVKIFRSEPRRDASRCHAARIKHPWRVVDQLAWGFHVVIVLVPVEAAISVLLQGWFMCTWHVLLHRLATPAVGRSAHP